MDDKTNKNSDTGAIQYPKTLLSKLDNFWYHYKWHTIVSLFLIIAITICSLQMCTKAKYDVNILYSGSHEIKRTSTDGDINEYNKFISSLARVTDDYDGDGNVSLSLKDLFMLSDQEMEEIQKADSSIEINRSLLMENKSILSETLIYSDYYVCLLSKSVYDEYKTVDDIEMFSPLSAYVHDTTSVKFYTDTAIYLSSTGFYSLPGISNLPDDTLICLRSVSAIANHFNEKDAAEARRRSIDVVENIINYTQN